MSSFIQRTFFVHCFFQEKMIDREAGWAWLGKSKLHLQFDATIISGHNSERIGFPLDLLETPDWWSFPVSPIAGAVDLKDLLKGSLLAKIRIPKITKHINKVKNPNQQMFWSLVRWSEGPLGTFWRITVTRIDSRLISRNGERKMSNFFFLLLLTRHLFYNFTKKH